MMAFPCKPGLVSRIGCTFALLVAAWFSIVAAHAGSVSAGKALYQTHCEQCHGQNGRPVMPGAPDFTRGDGLFQGDPSLLESIRSSRVIMHGFDGFLQDEEIFDIITYIRTFY